MNRQDQIAARDAKAAQMAALRAERQAEFADQQARLAKGEALGDDELFIIGDGAKGWNAETATGAFTIPY